MKCTRLNLKFKEFKNVFPVHQSWCETSSSGYRRRARLLLYIH